MFTIDFSSSCVTQLILCFHMLSNCFHFIVSRLLSSHLRLRSFSYSACVCVCVCGWLTNLAVFYSALVWFCWLCFFVYDFSVSQSFPRAAFEDSQWFVCFHSLAKLSFPGCFYGFALFDFSSWFRIFFSLCFSLGHHQYKHPPPFPVSKTFLFYFNTRLLTAHWALPRDSCVQFYSFCPHPFFTLLHGHHHHPLPESCTFGSIIPKAVQISLFRVSFRFQCSSRPPFPFHWAFFWIIPCLSAPILARVRCADRHFVDWRRPSMLMSRNFFCPPFNCTLACLPLLCSSLSFECSFTLFIFSIASYPTDPLTDHHPPPSRP